MKRICWRFAVAATLLLAAASASAQSADKFPLRPFRLVVPFVPGGSSDFIARIIGPGLREELKQPVIIDNRPGASGNIAAEIVAHSTPDGYSILLGNVGVIAVNPTLYRKKSLDPLRDLSCISLVADQPSVLVINPSLPAKTFKEFIEYAKSHPRILNYASAGTNGQLAMEVFLIKAGLEIGHVPYKGAGHVVTSLLSGETMIAFLNIPSGLSLVQSGRLKALAVKGPKRLEALPDVPALVDLGFPELNVDSWSALYVAAGTPKVVISKLHAAVAKVIQRPEIMKAMSVRGAEAIKPGSPEECTAFSIAQTEFWAKLARQTGLAGTL